jgi:hypothetical protein
MLTLLLVSASGSVISNAGTAIAGEQEFLTPDGTPPQWSRAECMARVDFTYLPDTRPEVRRALVTDWLDHALTAAHLHHIPLYTAWAAEQPDKLTAMYLVFFRNCGDRIEFATTLMNARVQAQPPALVVTASPARIEPSDETVLFYGSWWTDGIKPGTPADLHTSTFEPEGGPCGVRILLRHPAGRPLEERIHAAQMAHAALSDAKANQLPPYIRSIGRSVSRMIILKFQPPCENRFDAAERIVHIARNLPNLSVEMSVLHTGIVLENKD